MVLIAAATAVDGVGHVEIGWLAGMAGGGGIIGNSTARHEPARTQYTLDMSGSGMDWMVKYQILRFLSELKYSVRHALAERDVTLSAAIIRRKACVWTRRLEHLNA